MYICISVPRLEPMRRPRFLALVPKRPRVASPGFELKTKVFFGCPPDTIWARLEPMRHPRFLALVPKRPRMVSPGFELKTKVFLVALLVPSGLGLSQCGAQDFWLWCQSDPEWPPQDSNSRLRSFWLPFWYHLGYCPDNLSGRLMPVG